MSECVASVRASSSALPVMMLTTPSGRSEVSSTWYRSVAENGCASDGTTTTRLPSAMAGATSEIKPSSGASFGQTMPITPTGSERDGDAVRRRLVHLAVVFVGPRGVVEQTLNRCLHLFFRVLGTGHRGDAGGEFIGACRQVFGDVVQHLCAIVRRGLGPAAGFMRGFDGVADVLAAALAHFADEGAGRAVDRAAIAAVRARLFAADVQLGRAVDGEGIAAGDYHRRFRLDLGFDQRCGRTRVFRQRGHIFVHAFASALAAVARFAVAAEAASGVELVGGVNPYDTCLDLRRDVQCEADVFAPHASGQSVDGVVR